MTAHGQQPTDDTLLLWRARGGEPNVAELIGLVFGCVCAVVLVGVVLRRLHTTYLIVVVAVFALRICLFAIGAVRGRVVLRADGIEVRRVRTRLYPWATLRSIELDEGRIEITPNGWVRRLPVPASESAAAYRLILDWRDRAQPDRRAGPTRTEETR